MPEDILIEVLSSFGYPVMRQGSLPEDEEYPETFFTFWNNETNESGFYDNDNTVEITNFDVNIYSNDPQVTYDLLRQANKKLKATGFILEDCGHDVGSDVDTHTGRGSTVFYVNRV